MKFEDMSFIKGLTDKNIIIFGAGPAGKMIAWIIENNYSIRNYLFCDNDERKHNRDCQNPTLPVNEAIEVDNKVFLVGFLGNNTEKIQAVKECLFEKGVTEKDVVYLDMNDPIFSEGYVKYLDLYYYSLQKKKKEKIEKIKCIKFIASGFDESKERRGGGGPIGVVCMQKKMFGSIYSENVTIEYPYYPEIKREVQLIDKYPYITDAIEGAIALYANDEDTIYFVNDIFSAFGLYVLGKRYCLMFHAQGDVVKEMQLWGSSINESEEERIKRLEYDAVTNAEMVVFPSAGAEKSFRNCFDVKLNFQSLPPLYNTITDKGEPEIVDGIIKDESLLTFLSIGQMTLLKGMDRIPDFLNELTYRFQKKIRWIVVANGVLKDAVNAKMKQITDENDKFQYIQIDGGLSHHQIYYLQSIADIYLMLHRTSIFDFSTLEAMYFGKPVILSNISGNDEFNVSNNICLVDETVNWGMVEKYIHEKEYYGKLNKLCYDKYFSNDCAILSYRKIIDKLIKDIENE